MGQAVDRGQRRGRRGGARRTPPTRRRPPSARPCSRASTLDLRQRRRLPRLLAARRRARACSSASTTRPPRTQIEAGVPRAGGRVVAPGARDHQVARPRRARPRATRRAALARPARAGCWSAPTGCGTTPPSPPPSPRRSARRRAPDPAALALALTDFANGRGGQDNITAALARFGTSAQMPSTTRAECRPSRPPTRRPRRSRMAEFTAAVYQNEFLPDGGTDVNAIVTSPAPGPGTAGQAGGGVGRRDHHRRHLRLDGPADDGGAPRAPRRPRSTEILDGTCSRSIAGTDRRRPGLPAGAVRARAWCGWTPRPAPRRPRARSPASSRSGGTAIGTWLDLAGTLFASVPEVTQRHAILLTDGENRERPAALDAAIAARHRRTSSATAAASAPTGRSRRCAGSRRPCSAPSTSSPSPRQMRGPVPRDDADLDGARCRRRPAAGLGAAGRPGAVRPPGRPDGRGPHRPPRRGQRRSPAATPPAPGPTSRATTTSPSGWPAKAIGQEQLAARVQLALGDDVVAQGLVKATWSNDSELTTQIDPQVAHYTGQTELASMIQEGLAAKAAGDERDRHHQARPRRPARRRDRQRRGDLPAAQGRRHRRRERGHGAAQAARSTRPTRWPSTPPRPRPPGSRSER